MQADIVERVRNDPRFVELTEARGRFGWTLAIIMLVVYFGFIFMVAFLPGVLAINVGGAATLAFPLGLGVIVIAIVITGIYVLRANGRFDRLTREIVEAVR